MKTMKKTLALLMAVVMCMSLMSMAAFADETSTHTITIDNTDQNVTHTYQGYQIFKGKLDAAQQKLSDIVWGDNVNSDTLLNALKSSTDSNLMKEGANVFASCTTAAQVAEVLSGFTSTAGANESAGAIDAVAKIIGDTSGALKGSPITFTEGNGDNAGKYTGTATGDGYYFIKDTTTTLKDDETGNSDTLSKYLLAVVKDTTITAKDTGLTPDKEILGSDGSTVKTGTAAVGDLVTFQVTIPVPNTKKYVDHFVFDMKDKLPTGMTFMEVTSVTVGNDNVPNTVTVASAAAPTSFAAYTAPASNAAAVTTVGGQTIKVVFNDFKTNAEAGNWIGEDLVVTYTAVVNDKADFTPTGNKNEVVFDYSSDPNYDYDGDEPTGDEPMGTTPKDETTTLLTNIEIQKTGDNGTVAALPGAEFEITSNDYNVTLVTGEKYVTGDYTAQTGETVQDGTWYKLKDGSYTTTAPTTATASSYDSDTTTYKLVTFEKVDTTPGDAKKVTVITGTDGKIILNGLKPGTYTIKETKAPSGYNLDSTEYTIVLKFDETTKAIVLDTTSSEGVTFNDTSATASITIDNKGGTQLPSTGGIGTKIFYTMGAVLVIGAGVVLVSRKRAGE